MKVALHAQSVVRIVCPSDAQSRSTVHITCWRVRLIEPHNCRWLVHVSECYTRVNVVLLVFSRTCTTTILLLVFRIHVPCRVHDALYARKEYNVFPGVFIGRRSLSVMDLYASFFRLPN